jgi:hypothetical protein
MRGLAVLPLVFGLLAAQSAQAAPESRFTSIENKDCKFDPIGDEPGESDDQLKTCPGLGGAKVLVNAFHTRVRIGFDWSVERRKTKIQWPVEAWGAGLKVEWRGNATQKGFDPYAATVRMLYANDQGKAEQQVLAVIRVKRGEACLMGAVDIRANKNGYDLARNLADTAPSFDCKKDKSRILGIETEWSKNLSAPEMSE